MNIRGFGFASDELTSCSAFRVYSQQLCRQGTSQLDSVRALTDGSGEMQNRYRDRAFGETLSSLTSVSTQQPYQFTGERFDPLTGTYHLRARQYMPSIGHFTTWDPAEDFQNRLHRYNYAFQDPINALDPTGTFSLNNLVAVSIMSGCLHAIVVGYYGQYKGWTQDRINEAQWRWFLIGSLAGFTLYGFYAVAVGITSTAAGWVSVEGTIVTLRQIEILRRSALGGQYQFYRLTTDLTVYRYYSAGGNPTSNWWCLQQFANSAAARSACALPPGNTAEFLTEATIPAGKVVSASIIAPMFGQVGGAMQIWLANPNVVNVVQTGVQVP